MRRREFIGLLGGAVAWPVGARAQQTLPLVGFMDLGGPNLDQLLRSMAANGAVEGRDFRSERVASSFQSDQQLSQAKYFVERGAALIVANSQAAFAAQAATRSVPIIFLTVHDPVAVGLVQSMSRPGGNLTGVSMLHTALIAKRLEMLRELVPTAKSVAYLTNPTNKEVIEADANVAEAAAGRLAIELRPIQTSNVDEIKAAFATAASEKIGAVLLGSDYLYYIQRALISELAASHKLPTMTSHRSFAVNGSLISFGTHFEDAWTVIGAYAARILKGAKVSELPVHQVTKTELVINLKTAKVLGLSVPPALLARADEVIE
jgi:putative tryptophan/tyrosine transport system substrate-binding protein